MSLEIRAARPDDAADLAILIDMAGHGLPAWLWGRALMDSGASSAFEIGRARALREEGGFSWKNATVASEEGRIAGMLLGYRQPDLIELPADTDLDPVLVPLVALEAGAPGSWYVNAIAVHSEFRRQGVAGRLLAVSEDKARNEGASGLSLIVEDVNRSAIALYTRQGYREADRREFVAFAGGPSAGSWVLMTKQLASEPRQ